VKLPDNGEGVSLHSVTVNDSYPDGNQGWTTVETILLRFYTAYTPSGRFPVYLDSPIDVDERWMGYDAAVCVRKYEPWIIETYNATITSPSALRVIGKADGSTPLLPSGNIQGDQIKNTRYLNTTEKSQAFAVAHRISVELVTKDNNLDGRYRPYLTVGSVVPLCSISSNLNLLHRLFLSPMATDLEDTPNSPRTGSPSPSHGSVQLTFYHTLQGRNLSSHNCTRMRR